MTDRVVRVVRLGGFAWLGIVECFSMGCGLAVGPDCVGWLSFGVGCVRWDERAG